MRTYSRDEVPHEMEARPYDANGTGLIRANDARISKM
jgi:hypothetical protein